MSFSNSPLFGAQDVVALGSDSSLFACFSSTPCDIAACRHISTKEKFHLGDSIAVAEDIVLRAGVARDGPHNFCHTHSCYHAVYDAGRPNHRRSSEEGSNDVKKTIVKKRRRSEEIIADEREENVEAAVRKSLSSYW